MADVRCDVFVTEGLCLLDKIGRGLEKYPLRKLGKGVLGYLVSGTIGSKIPSPLDLICGRMMRSQQQADGNEVGKDGTPPE